MLIILFLAQNIFSYADAVLQLLLCIRTCLKYSLMCEISDNL